MTFEDVVGDVGKALDAAGVAILAFGAVAALGWFAVRSVRGQAKAAYRPTRQFLGRVILLGLEVLVAADIIRTVAIEPTLTSVAVLAGIVLVRTFLSFSLEVELEGTLPWRRNRAADDGAR